MRFKKLIRPMAGAFLLLSMMLGMFAITPQKAAAVDEPGCYELAAGSQKSTKRTCPADKEAGVAAGNCYLKTVVPRTVTDYELHDCGTIVLATTADSGTVPSFAKNDCNDVEVTQVNCGIVRYIVLFIKILSALVGVVVVGSIIYGGIQYSTAGSDPQKVSAAKKRILNAIIALVVFLFTNAFLEYIVPGGVYR